jgi:hypothetical protein
MYVRKRIKSEGSSSLFFFFFLLLLVAMVRFKFQTFGYWINTVVLSKKIYNNVTCSGYREKKGMGSGLGEAVCWVTLLQLQLQSL